MASAVSSYLSKSKKDFKPKAPLRRPGAPGSSQSSVRGSIDRQLQSQAQTPQPSTSQLIISLDPSIPAPTTSSTSVPEHRTPSDNILPSTNITAPLTSPLNPHDGERVLSIEVGTVLEPVPVIPKAVPSPTRTPSQGNAVAISIPTTRRTAERTSTASALTLPPIASQRRREDMLQEANLTSQSSNSPVPNVQPLSQEPELRDTQPTAKRRKINPPKKAAPTINSSTPRSAAATEPVTTQTTTLSTQTNSAPTNVVATVEGGGEPQHKKPRKKGQGAKAKGKQRLEEWAAAIVADATRGIEDDANPRISKKKRARSKRERQKTPENAETTQIEPSTVTMADLCRDMRIGKKSKREKALQDRDAEERLKKAQSLMDNAGTPAPTVTDEPGEATNVDLRPTEARAAVPGVRIVNGQFVLDESTRTIDRVAMANEARGDGEEVVVVDSLSHKVNSGTYLPRAKYAKWNEAMTDRFYDGLRMFGTDFGMISKMFPERSRRTIKLKFTHEEKFEKEKIQKTLQMDRLPVDMEAFSKMSKTVFMDPADLERDLAEDRKRLEEEQAMEKEAMDEAVRQRAADAAAEAAAEEAGVSEDLSAAENEVQRGGAGVKAKKGGKRTKKVTTGTQKKAPSTRIKSAKVQKLASKVPTPAPVQ